MRGGISKAQNFKKIFDWLSRSLWPVCLRVWALLVCTKNFCPQITLENTYSVDQPQSSTMSVIYSIHPLKSHGLCITTFQHFKLILWNFELEKLCCLEKRGNILQHFIKKLLVIFKDQIIHLS